MTITRLHCRLRRHGRFRLAPLSRPRGDAPGVCGDPSCIYCTTTQSCVSPSPMPKRPTSPQARTQTAQVDDAWLESRLRSHSPGTSGSKCQACHGPAAPVARRFLEVAVRLGVPTSVKIIHAELVAMGLYRLSPGSLMRHYREHEAGLWEAAKVAGVIGR